MGQPNLFRDKCSLPFDAIQSFLRIWSHLLKKSLMEKFNFLSSTNAWEYCYEMG